MSAAGLARFEQTLAGLKDLTKADLQAIARYLKSIPAVKNKIE